MDVKLSADWPSFIPFASMQPKDDGKSIEVLILDANAGMLTEAVYVWLGEDNAIIRIGTSKQPDRKSVV